MWEFRWDFQRVWEEWEAGYGFHAFTLCHFMACFFYGKPKRIEVAGFRFWSNGEGNERLGPDV